MRARVIVVIRKHSWQWHEIRSACGLRPGVPGAYEESKMAKPAQVRSLVVTLVWVSSTSAPSVAVPASASEPGFIRVSPALPVCVS